EAVHAAMLAAAVRIDGLVEADVGGLVAADDAARLLLGDDGLQARVFRFVGQGLQPFPAVVLQAHLLFLVAPVHERGAATATDGRGRRAIGFVAGAHAGMVARDDRTGGDCWLNAGSKAERLTVRSPALPAFTDDASKVRGPRQPTLRGNINGTPHIPSAPLGRTGRHAATALLRASAHPTSACKALPWGLRH